MKIEVSVTIHQKKEIVWDSYTKPEHIIHWNFASNDWYCPQATNDLSIWWKLVSTMSAKDQSMSFDFEGEYTNIIPFECIEYTILDMQYGDKYLEKWRKVKTTFIQESDGVKVTTLFDGEDIHSEELQKAWWQAILENFKQYTESL